MSPTHFRQLDAWQIAMQLVREVYLLCSELPRDERFGLIAQLQRSSVSIPSNIAEGNARQTTRDYARFVAIALGSTAELQTQLLLTESLQLIADHRVAPVLETCERVSQMLLRLHRALERKLEHGSRVPRPGSRITSFENA